MRRANDVPARIATPPIEGTNSEWILWTPGVSNQFNCLKIFIITGNNRNDIKNAIKEKAIRLGIKIIADVSVPVFINLYSILHNVLELLQVIPK